MQDYEFTVVIERDEDDRFVAICPALQGCYTEGETEAEARHLIEDAIRLRVESRIARNEPIYGKRTPSIDHEGCRVDR
jgi:predicted RNase H-like HicB family nuclease